jgi:hypothetical protein
MSALPLLVDPPFPPILPPPPNTAPPLTRTITTPINPSNTKHRHIQPCKLMPKQSLRLLHPLHLDRTSPTIPVRNFRNSPFQTRLSSLPLMRLPARCNHRHIALLLPLLQYLPRRDRKALLSAFKSVLCPPQLLRLPFLPVPRPHRRHPRSIYTSTLPPPLHHRPST